MVKCVMVKGFPSTENKWALHFCTAWNNVKCKILHNFPFFKQFIFLEGHHLNKFTAKQNMSDPKCGPRACGIVAIDILRSAQVLSMAKLNNKINLLHTWPPVYTHLYFDKCHVIFVGFMFSLLCAHAATDSSPFAR